MTKEQHLKQEKHFPGSVRNLSIMISCLVFFTSETLFCVISSQSLLGSGLFLFWLVFWLDRVKLTITPSRDCTASPISVCDIEDPGRYQLLWMRLITNPGVITSENSSYKREGVLQNVVGPTEPQQSSWGNNRFDIFARVAHTFVTRNSLLLCVTPGCSGCSL